MASAAQHKVEPAVGYYRVTSATSGNVYKVVPLGGPDAACQCERYRRTGQACSHIGAVQRHARQVLELEGVLA